MRDCNKFEVEYSGRQHMIVEGGMYETYFIRAVPGSKVGEASECTGCHRALNQSTEVRAFQILLCSCPWKALAHQLITQGLLVAGAIESCPAAEGEEQWRRAF